MACNLLIWIRIANRHQLGNKAISGGSQNSPIKPFPPTLKMLQPDISGLKRIRIVDVQKNVEVRTVQVKTIALRLNLNIFIIILTSVDFFCFKVKLQENLINIKKSY